MTATTTVPSTPSVIRRTYTDRIRARGLWTLVGLVLGLAAATGIILLGFFVKFKAGATEVLDSNGDPTGVLQTEYDRVFTTGSGWIGIAVPLGLLFIVVLIVALTDWMQKRWQKIAAMVASAGIAVGLYAWGASIDNVNWRLVLLGAAVSVCLVVGGALAFHYYEQWLHNHTKPIWDRVHQLEFELVSRGLPVP